jgi:putative nucleotidyltransferase with HDIG domain
MRDNKYLLLNDYKKRNIILSKNLKRRLQFEKLVGKISAYFATLPSTEFDKAINFSLKKISQFMRVDRGLFFLFSSDHKHFSCCSEWREKNIKSVLESTQNLPANKFAWFYKEINCQSILKINDVDLLSKNVAYEKKIWKDVGIKSLIIVRLLYRNNLLGFLSFESLQGIRKWTDEDSSLLIILAQTIARVYIRKNIALQLEAANNRLENALLQTIRVLSKTVETKDPYTAGHQHETALLAKAIAKEMRLSDNQIKGIEFGAVLHDIGKIYIPSEILNRPGKLTDLEMNIIRTHPQTGYNLLKNVTFPWPIADIALKHHERMDGSGYPNKLKAKEIPIEVRIVSVADVVEAMSSHRPYRAAHTLKEALHEISKNKGKLYDTKVVNACLKVFKKGFKFKPHENIM